MTRVKICGLSDIKSALAAAEAGADYLGFIFAQSKRQVTPENAASIISEIRRLDKPLLKAGIFVNEKPAEVNRIAEYCRLDFVQLSGDETPAYCCQIKYPIIKVIHVSAGETSEAINKRISLYRDFLKSRNPIFLLDTRSNSAYGGTGQLLNWDLITGLPAEYPIFIAGGLTPENAGALVQKYTPWGVDVSSGVETNGKKDSRKIRAFIETVKRQVKIC